MQEFTRLLTLYRAPIARYVHFRISSYADAEDVLQEICLYAYQRFPALRDRQAFLAWLMAIARTKCADYFRACARRLDLPMELREEQLSGTGVHGRSQKTAVRETLSAMARSEQKILYLYYYEQLPQADIARHLGIPIGTVKSRIYTARARFRTLYPYPPRAARDAAPQKGEAPPMKLPETLPAYTITPSLLPPFSVRFEEMPGWMIVPRLGESRSWGLYEAPGGRRTEYYEESVVGRAQVHGIEGVEITATQYNTENYYRTGAIDRLERRFIAQLTDTHCRVLAESHVEDGVRKLFTFLDGDPFLNNWGFGENNCGSQVQIAPKGLLCREGDRITSAGAATIDVTGRYIVELCGKRYDTICLTDTDTFEDGILSETYIDADGHTVLWRRFNKNDWALQHFGPRTWQERLPDNETRLVNDALYVHWYDCVTDYIG